MNRVPPRIISRLFWLLATIHLLAVGLEYDQWIFVTKPVLIPLLLWYYLVRSSRQPLVFRLLVSAALLFSWAGDCFLLVLKSQPGSGNFFLFGLASFLLAHLSYIGSFRLLMGKLLLKKWWLAIPILVYLGGFLVFLWPDLPDDLRIPVSVYGIVISTMLLAGIHFGAGLSRQGFNLLTGGAVLFVLSDSMIALGKFSYSTNLSFWIMLTYILAQWLLVQALTSYHPEE